VGAPGAGGRDTPAYASARCSLPLRAGSTSVPFRGCLVPTQKLYTPSHRIFGDMHGALNIDKK
jgi:hypothetical protein